MAKRWTEAEIEDLKLGVEEGLSHACIGEVLGRTAEAIKQKCHKLSISNKVYIDIDKSLLEKYINEGLTNYDMSEIFNCGIGAIKDRKREYNLGGLTKNSRKPTTIEYIEKIKHLGVYLNSGQVYVNNKVKLLHTCKTCTYQMQITPSDVINGYGCAKCAGNKLKTTEEYVSQVPENIQVLEPYINAKTPILHRYVACGHTSMISPTSILKRHGCGTCGSGSHKNSNRKCSIYFIKLDIGYKIGISANIKYRFSDFKQNNVTPIEIINTTGIIAYKMEQELHEQFKEYSYYNESISGNGATECFSEDLPVQEVIDLMYLLKQYQS